MTGGIIAGFIVEGVLAAMLLVAIAVLAIQLKKLRQAEEGETFAPVEETAVTAAPLSSDEEEPYDEPLAEEPAAEIVTDDGADIAETETAAAVEPCESEALSPEQTSYRLAKSFTAKLIQADDIVKARYSELKNALLSYKKVKARTSRKCETYRRGRKVFAKLNVRGKTLCLYLALTEEEIPEKKYRVESAGKRKADPVTPVLYKIKNERRVKYAKELISFTAEKRGLTPIERQAENFAPAYQTEEELIAQGLIKYTKSSAFLRK